MKAFAHTHLRSFDGPNSQRDRWCLPSYARQPENGCQTTWSHQHHTAFNVHQLSRYLILFDIFKWEFILTFQLECCSPISHCHEEKRHVRVYPLCSWDCPHPTPPTPKDLMGLVLKPMHSDSLCLSPFPFSFLSLASFRPPQWLSLSRHSKFKQMSI